MDFSCFYWIQSLFKLFFSFSIAQNSAKNYWDQKLTKCVSFWPRNWHYAFCQTNVTLLIQNSRSLQNVPDWEIWLYISLLLRFEWQNRFQANSSWEIWDKVMSCLTFLCLFRTPNYPSTCNQGEFRHTDQHSKSNWK